MDREPPLSWAACGLPVDRTEYPSLAARFRDGDEFYRCAFCRVASQRE